ncbi:type IX secretion system plug protein domain-containing protein, partial [Acinetobacter baumannii]
MHVSYAQQNADAVYAPNIKTVKLFQQNNQESLPVLQLNSEDIIELHFDDVDGYAKNYYYSFVLCNADWQ